jgi:hypothetical protein
VPPVNPSPLGPAMGYGMHRPLESISLIAHNTGLAFNALRSNRRITMYKGKSDDDADRLTSDHEILGAWQNERKFERWLHQLDVNDTNYRIEAMYDEGAHGGGEGGMSGG